MKLFKAATTVGCIALIGAVLAPSVKADEWNGGLCQRPGGDAKGVVTVIPYAKDRFHRVH